VTRYVGNAEYFLVEAEAIEEVCNKSTEVEALIRSVNSTFENYVKLNKKIPPEMIMSVASIDEPARLADTIVAHLGIKLEDKQTLLEMINPAERLEKVLGFMRSEIEILEVEKRIRTRVKKQMEKTQKEYYLNEQMRAIQKELGEKDEFKNEIQELEEKIKQKKMSARRGRGGKELKKLKMMSPMSAEATSFATTSTGSSHSRGTSTGRQARHQRRGEGPRGGSLRAREGEAAHPRVPRRPEPRWAAQGPDSSVWWGRPRGQDVARQVDAQGHRTEVRPCVARWCA